MISKEDVKRRLDEIQKEIEALEKESNKLRKNLNEIEVRERKAQIQKGISLVSKNNTMTTSLYRNTKTTPLMDKFYNSKKMYLSFDHIFWVFKKSFKKYLPVSLILQRQVQGVPYIDDGLTMTDLKKASGSYIIYVEDWYPSSSRIDSLMKELNMAVKRINKENKRTAFKNLIRIGGQTYANQTGFGSEYNGEELVYEGTLYGETTGFFVIGIIAE